ncbi:MAG: PAS domain S-box protein [Deltaproteobacteria bacterium]|nr:PAS domain S-box protein [Deltaproteobacteria bacterium]
MDTADKQNNKAGTFSICQVTGLPVLQKPEWTKVRFDDHFVVTYRKLGDHIIHIQPSGYASLKGVESHVAFVGKLVHEFFAKGIPIVSIQDYQELHGVSMEARRYFINYYKTETPLICVIFCHTSAFMKLAIKLAQRFYTFRFQLFFVNNYADAVTLARNKLSEEIESSTGDVPVRSVMHYPIHGGTGQEGGSLIIEAGQDAPDNRFQDDTLQKNIHEILQFIGRIHWKSDGVDKTIQDFDRNHPFASVFDAILLIKTDLDQSLKERMMAEEELRKSEEKYKQIVSNISDLLYFHDLDGTFRNSNFVYMPALGYTESELENLNVRDLIPKKFRHEFEEYLKRIKKHGKDEGLMRVVTKDGAEHILEYRNTLVYATDGSQEPVGVQGFASDVTDRMHAEKALRESEEKYRSILENMEEGYYEVDLDGNLLFFNHAIIRLLGYPEDELKGMNYKTYIAPEYTKKVYDIFNNVFRTGRPVKEAKYEVILRDKSKRIVDISVSLIKNSKGEPIGFRGIIRDVTELVLTQEERKRLRAKLQHAQKMEAIGTLAGGVAHDLNNILSGLVSYPELLLMDLPRDSHLRKPIQIIQKSGEKAAAIVQDLLTLARRGVSIKVVVSLNNIISEYLKSPEYEKLLSYHPHVSVEIRLEEALLYIIGSPVHLAKTVMNLVSNAAEAMPEGGMLIISTQNLYIDNPLEDYAELNLRVGEYVVLKVTDTGTGISSEDMEHIFDPFYTKKVMGRTGTGLGMAVVWGAVKDHQGSIDLESQIGKGTTFTIYFPATREEPKKVEPSLFLEKYASKGESILVVDDVEEQRFIASGMLTKLGYTVVTVHSGEEAVSYLEKHRVDLVLLDMIMDPGIDGLETYRRILQYHPRQKAIIASGFSETIRVKEARRLGAGAYIKKPYLLEKIGLAIRTELDRN